MSVIFTLEANDVMLNIEIPPTAGQRIGWQGSEGRGNIDGTVGDTRRTNQTAQLRRAT
jgi:hypothetical protein